jgi:hypothetical protein
MKFLIDRSSHTNEIAISIHNIISNINNDYRPEKKDSKISHKWEEERRN